MLNEEKSHLQELLDYTKNHRVRPSVLLPLAHGLGLGLGVLTGLIGERACKIATEAVEERVGLHYNE